MSEKVIKAVNVRMSADPMLQRKHMVRFGESEAEGCLLFHKAPVSQESSRREEDEKSLAQGKKEAYENGYAAGAACQKQQSLLTLKALEGTLHEAQDLKKRLYAETEGQMLNLILAIAEKVIYEEVSVNNKAILAVLREAVKNVVEREGMKIRLNPKDYQFIVEMKPDFFLGMEGMRNISFEADAAIKQGGALLETAAGEVDARLEQRINEIKTALKIN